MELNVPESKRWNVVWYIKRWKKFPNLGMTEMHLVEKYWNFAYSFISKMIYMSSISLLNYIPI